MIIKNLRCNKIAEHVNSLNMGIMLLVLVVISVVAVLAKLFSLITPLSLKVVLISTFVLYICINVAVMRRYVLKPLAKLAESVSQITGTGTENVALYSGEHKDEIGDLSQTIQHMRDTLKAQNFELQKLKAAKFEAQAALKHHKMLLKNTVNRNMQRDFVYTDTLTGACNRRYLIEAGEQELRHCIEKNMDFAVIMIDIDNFKFVNDFYGHFIGDVVLKILTTRLRHILKHNTLLARYGGEEFVATFPGVKYEDVVKTAWKMQKAIEASAFLIADLMEINVTASFGVAFKTVKRITLSDIINNADKALYQAKKNGKNTVVAL